MCQFYYISPDELERPALCALIGCLCLAQREQIQWRSLMCVCFSFSSLPSPLAVCLLCVLCLCGCLLAAMLRRVSDQFFSRIDVTQMKHVNVWISSHMD